MDNYWALGDRGFAPFQGGTNVFSISDSFDMIRGKHNIRVGGSIRAQQMNVETNAFQDGFFINFGALQVTPPPISSGPDGRRHPRSDVQRRHHRPPLEAVPALRSG